MDLEKCSRKLQKNFGRIKLKKGVKEMEKIEDIMKMAEAIITNEEALKEANEMLKITNDYDLVTKLTYEKFFKKEVMKND